MSSGSIRIIQLPEKSSVNTDDYMAVDSSTNGTKKVKFTDLLDNNLSAQNKAADAQATGEAIGELNTNINNANARIDNLIINGEPSVETLWTGTLQFGTATTATLSESVSNYDFLDFYTDDNEAHRVRVSSGSIEIKAVNTSDDASLAFFDVGEALYSFSGTTVTLVRASEYRNDQGAITITANTNTYGNILKRVDGIKMSSVALSEEVSDIRIGDDGVTYQTAGDAVRTQFADVKADTNNIGFDLVDLLGKTGYEMDLLLEQGSLTSGGAVTNNDYNKFVRSKTFVRVPDGVNFYCDTNGFSVYVFFYDDSYTFTSVLWNKWQPFDFNLPSGSRYLKVSIKKNDSSDITPSVVETKIYCKGLFDTLPNDINYGLKSSSNINDGLILGDIYNGAYSNSNYRMVAKKAQILNVPVTLTTDWSAYRIYLWKYNGSTWTGVGWKTSDTYLEEDYTYQFVIGRKDDSTTALTADEQADIYEKTMFLSDIWSSIRRLNVNYPRLMSRQGEGYGYPDNSYLGIISAIADGYKKIRIAVAVTSDDKFYCTHSYELENNSTLKYVTLNGSTYPNDIDITEETSSFIDSILYKGYAIPTLDSVMAELVKYPIEITWELKNNFTDAQLQLLIDKANYYNMPIVWSGTYTQIDQLTAINTNLNIAVIFNYTDALGNGFKGRYANKYKTMRYDCYWGDVVSESSVVNIIHPDVKLKFGAGTTPSASDLMTYMQWVDVCEVPYKISTL